MMNMNWREAKGAGREAESQYRLHTVQRSSSAYTSLQRCWYYRTLTRGQTLTLKGSPCWCSRGSPPGAYKPCDSIMVEGIFSCYLCQATMMPDNRGSGGGSSAFVFLGIQASSQVLPRGQRPVFEQYACTTWRLSYSLGVVLLVTAARISPTPTSVCGNQ